MSFLKDNGKVILINISVFVCVLLLLELIVRFSTPHIATPRELRANAPEYEPSRFTKHPMVQKEHEVLRKGSGGERLWKINRHGYRGPDFAFEKSAGGIRVIIYGGSAAFNMGVTEGEDWPRKTELKLRQRGLTNVEVINAGIPGHASHDSLGYFFAEGHLLSPDYVLLYNAWNDIHRFPQAQPLLRTAKPYGGPDANPFHTYSNIFDKFLSEYSQVYLKIRQGLLKELYRKIMRQPDPKKQVVFHDSLAPAALRQYEFTLRCFVDMVRNAGGVPILMTQGRLVRSDNTQEEKTKIKYKLARLQHNLLLEAFKKTDLIIHTVAQEKNIPLIDAAPVMTPHGFKYFFDTVHMRPAGSEALAEHVAARLYQIITAKKQASNFGELK